MKRIILSLSAILSTVTIAAVEPTLISESVYVESPTDTDKDGMPDRIYVSIERPNTDKKLSTIFRISPYALGGTEVPMHNVDYDLLPQDDRFLKHLSSDIKRAFNFNWKTRNHIQSVTLRNAPRYAQIKAHSVGTGYSTGCPTVGDMSETLAAKAVIDWLNGRARAFYQDGREAKADWANGKVGMTGTSYDGTLPIMVATTGVEGLKAIIPVAAISNWYNYYRANGLVVNPGGYIGEDADILGYYIVRKNACRSEMANITRSQGRENGDFTPFWQKRNYLPMVKNIKAATFIIHGQSDWNVKQKHAIDLWEALEGGAPRRMFLHKGGHSSTSAHNVPKKVEAWLAHFLEGENNGITSGPQVEVELPDGKLIQQSEWPHENARVERLFLAKDSQDKVTIIDNGSSVKLETQVANPGALNEGRIIFLSEPLDRRKLLTGTTKVSLQFSVNNRKAANLTVAIVDYDKSGKGKIITRGWADPQNYKSMKRGEKLVPGKEYVMSFDIEPKEYLIEAGNKIGIVVTSTDFEYTLRPKAGTEIDIIPGNKTYVDLSLADHF